MTMSTAPTASWTFELPAASGRRRVPAVVLFGASSLTSWTVDYTLVLTLSAVMDPALVAVVTARLISSSLNFLVNRRVFNADSQSLRSSATGYVAAQSALLGASYLLLAVLQSAGLALWIAKVLADSSLFAVNYLVQSRLVYRAGRVREALVRLASALPPATTAA